MKSRISNLRPAAIRILLSAFCLLPSTLALAFPPSPHHLFYGMVRDEYGTPINDPEAIVVLETVGGVHLKGAIVPGLEPGVNYRLTAPMDSGLSSDLYKPTALRPQAPFLIKVVIAGVVYLPIEMTGDYSQLGKPGKRTLLNLTLGEDSDGDGLPDAWERMINGDLSKVGPNEDSDGDGLSNLNEYLAGTFAFDPEDGFTLEIAGVNNGRPALEFTALRGRSYTIMGSSNLKDWSPVTFRIPAEGEDAPARTGYTSTDVRLVRVEVDESSTGASGGFFKLIVQ